MEFFLSILHILAIAFAVIAGAVLIVGLAYLIVDASLTRHFQFPDQTFSSFFKVYLNTKRNRLLHILHKRR